ncbi:hypothetical protein [Pseudoxanthomonas sp. J35]|uniref:hypothetical protein n=1 Tax=Pseudoxanthomonas sp. J35 TaxID=935852 RepID=UPI00048B5B60|nr:hypothetical protein [Pseudoxanthomonas sp. J35]
MRALAAAFFGLALMPAAAIAAPDCSGSSLQQPLPLASTAVVPVAMELGSRTSQLGMPSGVLTPEFDSAQSLDRVLLRLRIENCRNVAKALPAAYKPKTEFDNTPWRFNMTQDGKRMTVDEFEAWMKARGARVATGKPTTATPAAAPAAATAAPAN